MVNDNDDDDRDDDDGGGGDDDADDDVDADNGFDISKGGWVMMMKMTMLTMALIYLKVGR